MSVADSRNERATGIRTRARRPPLEGGVSNAEIGRKLREARILRGFGLEEFARLTGHGRSSIAKYENGMHLIPCAMVYAAARATNLPVSFFYGEMASPIGVPAGEDSLAGEARHVAVMWRRIRDRKLRRAIGALVRRISAASETQGSPDGGLRS